MIDPFKCNGCHSGDFYEFDHFCDTLKVPTGKEHIAFAAWLGGRFDWDGEYSEIEPVKL